MLDELGMDSERLDKQIAFIELAGKLKGVKRRIWLMTQI